MDICQQIRQIIEMGTYSSPKPPLEERIYNAFKVNGAGYIEKNFSNLIEGERLGGPLHFVLNQIGYNLLNMNKLPEALEIFKLNVSLFPGETNPHDSLAEAYILNDNTEKALEQYKKVLELDPSNKNAEQYIEKLERIK